MKCFSVETILTLHSSLMYALSCNKTMYFFFFHFSEAAFEESSQDPGCGLRMEINFPQNLYPISTLHASVFGFVYT